MKTFFCAGGFFVALGLAAVNPALAADQAPSNNPAAVNVSDQEARLVSAFFGLDNDLPFGANRLCFGASGKDGMPVVFSHTLHPDTLQAEDFEVVTQSGDVRTPKCVTLRPAQDPGELRTVLLIGEFGDSPDNPPVSVKVVGDLLSDGAPPVNFNGTRTNVTPLVAGPSMVLAEPVPESEWTRKTSSTSCPKGVKQVIRVTWAGGVRRPDGDEPGEAERELYRVTVKRPDGSSDEINPVALAELEDTDNNHFLCLDTTDPAVAISFPAGHLVDPNKDMNPDTRITVSRVVN